MPRARRKAFWRSLRRRLFIGLALAAYLAVAVGFPLPARAPKGAAGSFPCQGLACGCASADECRQTCCCSSPRVQSPQAGGACCQRGDSCPSESPEQSCCADGPKDDRPASAGVRWVAGVSALRCRGLSTVWVSAGAVLPPPAPLTWSPWPAPGAWLTFPAPAAARLVRRPPTPPPR